MRERATPPTAVQLRLNTRDNARRSLARLIRDFHADPAADVDRFKALVHALNVLLAYDKTAEELALGERLDAIEAALAEREAR